MGTHSTETGSPELFVTWRGLAAQGPWAKRPRGTLGGGGSRDKGRTRTRRYHCDLPPLPRFRFSGAGLQLPTRLTAYKTARPASCQEGRGGNPRNMGMHGTETGSPELLVSWRGLMAQGPMGQEAKRDVERRRQQRRRTNQNQAVLL
jgi:hypothetical protein